MDWRGCGLWQKAIESVNIIFASRRFQFQKRSQHLIGTHNETLPVTIRVHNPDCFVLQGRELRSSPSSNRVSWRLSAMISQHGNRLVSPLLTASSIIPVMPACMLMEPNPCCRNEWPVHCDEGIHYVWPFKLEGGIAVGYRFRDCGPHTAQTEQSGATAPLTSPSQRAPNFISWRDQMLAVES